MAAQPGTILVVIHDFTARSLDELTLQKGDRIELIEGDNEFGDGWYLGKHVGNGRTGLFPEVYTRPAPKGVTNQFSTSRTPLDKRASSDNYTGKTRQDGPQNYRASAPTAPSSLSPITSHNPVMNETLDVIKEHINDLKAPGGNAHRGGHHDLSPQLTSPSFRTSYIQGQETDEEESQQHNEREVLTWSPSQVAEYLEDQGVEKSHCAVFQEQEISGEILLGMEQSSIFIKEFELGSVGRRLKTWQKVKALQDEVRNTARTVSHTVPSHSPGHSPKENSAALAAAHEVARRRSSTIAGPTTSYLVPNAITRAAAEARSNTMSSTQGQSPNPDNSIRPSAHSIRTMQHSRRHSSLGSEASMQKIMSPTGTTTATHSTAPSSKTSTDKSRTNSGLETFTRRTSTMGHRHNNSGSSHASQAPPDWGLGPMGSPQEVDRGYFSGNEVDKRNRRSVLQKKSVSAAHSRNPSETTLGNLPSIQTQAKIDSPMNQSQPPSTGLMGKIRGLRSASSPKTTTNTDAKPDETSPIVTKLDYEEKSPNAEQTTTATGHSPGGALSFFSKPRLTGLRVTSDTTGSEKTSAPLTSPTRTGSTTPSTETQSIDQQKARLSTGSSQGVGQTTPNPASTPRLRPRARSKKFTSAYTKGLEKKPPIEQIEGADYSGWMKKKSASLVGTWKPRLFILRGRRLSYYYSENDTEEKGLIDISGHRVLPAEGDRITGIHATLTGAKSPQSPENLAFVTGADMELAAVSDKPPVNDGLFIFKLVPPREGMSKAVNFTKPTVHYFAVNNRKEGRLWMAALMKATIDHDSSGKVTTSYNQPTISLTQAKARRERPPALREGSSDLKKKDDGGVADLDTKRADSGRGLGIGGLGELDGASEHASIGSEYPSTLGGGDDTIATDLKIAASFAKS